MSDVRLSRALADHRPALDLAVPNCNCRDCNPTRRRSTGMCPNCGTTAKACDDTDRACCWTCSHWHATPTPEENP